VSSYDSIEEAEDLQGSGQGTRDVRDFRVLECRTIISVRQGGEPWTPRSQGEVRATWGSSKRGE
jgi:hypothetical protein